MKQLIYIPLLFFTFAACKDKKKDPVLPVPSATSNPSSPAADDQQSTDSVIIRTVIKDFYNWYKKNDQKLMAFQLYDGIKKTDRPPYRIDWKEVDKYHQFIRTNVPQLGEEFIMNQKQFFQECDSAFKVDKEDDIPYGFDYDWYTGGQEGPEYLVKEVNKPGQWAMKWSGDYVTVDIKGVYNNNGKKEETTFVTVKMRKEGEEWKIAKIGHEL